ERCAQSYAISSDYGCNAQRDLQNIVQPVANETTQSDQPHQVSDMCANQKNHASDPCVPCSRERTFHPKWDVIERLLGFDKILCGPLYQAPLPQWPAQTASRNLSCEGPIRGSAGA